MSYCHHVTCLDPGSVPIRGPPLSPWHASWSSTPPAHSMLSVISYWPRAALHRDTETTGTWWWTNQITPCRVLTNQGSPWPPAASRPGRRSAPWSLGKNLFQSWSNFKKLIDSGNLLGQYQVVDVNSFVRKASNRYREAYLWILSRYSYGSIKSPLSWSNFRFYFVTWTFKSGLGMFAMLCSFQNWYWKVKLGKI